MDKEGLDLAILFRRGDVRDCLPGWTRALRGGVARLQRLYDYIQAADRADVRRRRVSRTIDSAPKPAAPSAARHEGDLPAAEHLNDRPWHDRYYDPPGRLPN